MATRGGLAPHVVRHRDGRVARVLPDAQRVTGRRQQLRRCRFLRPGEVGCGRGLPLQACGGIAVVRLAQRHKVGVVIVVVLDEHALVLQADDGYAIPEILGEGGDPEAEGRARAGLLSRGGGFAPVDGMNGPCVRYELWAGHTPQDAYTGPRTGEGTSGSSSQSGGVGYGGCATFDRYSPLSARSYFRHTQARNSRS